MRLCSQPSKFLFGSVVKANSTVYEAKQMFREELAENCNICVPIER